MKETRLAYIAGLIEADGGFSISKSITTDGYVSFDPTIRLKSTHLPTIKWVISQFGGSYLTFKWDNPDWKDAYEWKFTSDLQAVRFLDSLLPFLWIKKPQALVLMDYYALRGACAKSTREKLYQKIKALNQSEPVTTNTSRLPLEGKNKQAYIAGLFDGEGSSYIIKVKQSKGFGVYYRSEVCLGMTCRRVIDALLVEFGGHFRQRPPHNGVLPMYEWSLKDNKRRERFLLAVLPYLVTKRKQSQLVLEFTRMNGEVNPAKRQEMWLECSLLNGNKRESDLHSDVQSAPTVTLAA